MNMIFLVIIAAAATSTQASESFSHSYSYSSGVNFNVIEAIDEAMKGFSEAKLEEAVSSINQYFKQDERFGDLILVGDKEKMNEDFACDCKDDYTYESFHFAHLKTGEDVYDELSADLQKQVDYVNSFTESPGLPWNQQNNGGECGWLGDHTLGFITKKAIEAGVPSGLQSCGYGTGEWMNLRVYASCCSFLEDDCCTAR
jgi:hypothetical protein